MAAVVAMAHRRAKGGINEAPEIVDVQVLPEESKWLRVAEFDKMVGLGDVQWQRRRVILTSDELLYAPIYSQQIVDRVSLNQIGDVTVEEKAKTLLDMEKMSTRGEDIHCLSYTQEDAWGQMSYLVLRGKATVCAEWATAIIDQVKVLEEQTLMSEELTPLEKVQYMARRLYCTNSCEFVVGALIVANFINTIIEYELFTEASFEGSNTQRVCGDFEKLFTIVFAFELLLNLAANLWTDFVNNGWALFDLVVVPLTFIGMFVPSWPAIGVVRLLRVFRVLKLFQRLSSLRIIINALLKSILPCLNAFGVLFLVTAIYAVVATMLFFPYDAVLFGKFSSSLYTMFQVCTGDGWSTDVVRPMFALRSAGYSDACMPLNSNLRTTQAEREQAIATDKCVEFLDTQGDGYWGQAEWLTVLFFVSYIVIAGYFLLNIVVAVLLDEFVNAVGEERDSIAQANQVKSRMFSRHKLDPLMENLCTHMSHEDLKKRIRSIYQVMDPDRSGYVTYQQWQTNTKHLDMDHPILFSPEEWSSLVEHEFPLMSQEMRSKKDKHSFSATDTDNDGLVNFAEFVALPCNSHRSEQELRRSFDKLDVDDNGMLDKKEFESFFLPEVTYQQFELIMLGQLEAYAFRSSAHRMMSLAPNCPNYYNMLLTRQVLMQVNLDAARRHARVGKKGGDGQDADAMSTCFGSEAGYGDEITPDLLPPPQRQATPPVTSLRLEATPELHESVPALEMQAGRGASTVSTLGFPVATPETTPRDSAGIKRGAGGAQGKGKKDGVKGGAGQMDYDVVAEHAANALEDRLRLNEALNSVAGMETRFNAVDAKLNEVLGLLANIQKS